MDNDNDTNYRLYRYGWGRGGEGDGDGGAGMELVGDIQSCLIGPVSLEKADKQRYPQLWPQVLLISSHLATLIHPSNHFSIIKRGFVEAPIQAPQA